ncbi:hypothetical protein [Zobellia alginiliquefaciens]|uniref:hypothetical protein n=1 Tax=Zobellia alginiliquefaciens TaxID=3032586 RepID=UPI0023E43175|nr:hypothetical protein [Zobellia alginiliquefaciens]
MRKTIFAIILICGLGSMLSSCEYIDIKDIKDFVDDDNVNYIKPQWFGATMDGVTDDRDAFVATLDAADSTGKKIIIDKDIFLDVEEIGAKTIFIPDNIYIEGKNGAKIIVNHLRSPAFIMALSNNVTIKDITILYDNAYDASINYGSDASIKDLNQANLQNYLETERNITFNNSNPIYKGAINFMYTFLLYAASDINFDNVKFKAKGKTADTFMIGGIKFNEQYNSDQEVVDNDLEDTNICRNITFKNLVFDGTLMGVQGIVKNFESTGLRSYRYSDAQSADGSNIGGADKWMPPPHLIYLNSDNSPTYNCSDVRFIDTVDYGEYVGNEDVRGSSGYCHSLKLVDKQNNPYVDGYKSFRRDGLGDFGGIENGVFKDIYAEFNSSIFSASWQFNAFRWVGTVNNSSFQNIELQDNAAIAAVYPLDAMTGSGNLMDAIDIYVKELNTIYSGPFGISGSGNTIINSTLDIETHSSTQEWRGVVYHNDLAMNEGGGNHYEVVVKGWRDISPNPRALRSRMLFAKPVNPNNNYAKVIDLNNHYIIEQINNEVTATWTITETVDLGSLQEQQLEILVDADYSIVDVQASVLSDLDANITSLSLGTNSGAANNLLPNISTTGSTIANINEPSLTGSGSDRSLYLRGNTSFNDMGEVKVTMTLRRIDTN